VAAAVGGVGRVVINVRVAIPGNRVGRAGHQAVRLGELVNVSTAASIPRFAARCQTMDKAKGAEAQRNRRALCTLRSGILVVVLGRGTRPNLQGSPLSLDALVNAQHT
jgi:hypothetical protein